MTLDPLYPDVALYGLPGSGKTTAASFLERLGYTRVSFVGHHKGGLRDIVARMGLDPNDRRTLNIIGMAGREVDLDVWVRSVLALVERFEGAAVNDDMRADNEWRALRGAGFVLIHVVSDVALREERPRLNGKLGDSDVPFLWLLENDTLYHPDHVVINNGTQDELFEQVTDILNIERGRRA